MDDDHGSHVGVAADADEGAEMQFEVGAELKASVMVRQRHGALDGGFNGQAGGVGKVVEGQNDDVVAHTDSAVFAAIGHDFRILEIHDYHLLVLTLWT